MWELWTICRDLRVEPLTGYTEWRIDWAAFQAALPAARYADDEERAEAMWGLRFCQATVQNPASALDEDDADG